MATLTADPNLETLTDTTGADALNQMIAAANEALAAGDVARVRECLRAAFELSGEDGELALALGHAELNGGGLNEALTAYTAAVALLPSSALAHASRSLACQLLGHSAEATREARLALTFDANELIALKVMARIHLNAKQPDLAQDFCRRILRREANDADARTMMEEAVALQIKMRPPASKVAGVSAISETLKKLEPLAGDYTARTKAWRALGPEHLLQLLSVGNYEAPIRIEPKPGAAEIAPDGFAIPPVDLRMGYGAGDLKVYLECGARSAAMLREVISRNGVTLERGDKMLDWGGASGRVVRNFAPEAQRGVEVWGCDVHAPSVEWAKNHLSPPFKFFNSVALPQLPFPEASFKFICGFSVFTHLVVMRDQWLLELRRALRPDGCIVLTVHDESTWAWFRKNWTPDWMPAQFRALPEMPGELIDIRGSSWEHCYTFFHSEYIRRIWGQYFQVAEIIPAAEGYQTAVVLKHL